MKKVFLIIGMILISNNAFSNQTKVDNAVSEFLNHFNNNEYMNIHKNNLQKLKRCSDKNKYIKTIVSTKEFQDKESRGEIGSFYEDTTELMANISNCLPYFADPPVEID